MEGCEYHPLWIQREARAEIEAERDRAVRRLEEAGSLLVSIRCQIVRWIEEGGADE